MPRDLILRRRLASDEQPLAVPAVRAPETTCCPGASRQNGYLVSFGRGDEDAHMATTSEYLLDPRGDNAEIHALIGPDSAAIHCLFRWLLLQRSNRWPGVCDALSANTSLAAELDPASAARPISFARHDGRMIPVIEDHGVAFPTVPEYFSGIGKYGGQNAMSDIRHLPSAPHYPETAECFQMPVADQPKTLFPSGLAEREATALRP